MYPGGWIPAKLYAPPRRKISKAKLKALKELYEEAREVIPEPQQVGLVAPAIVRGGRAVRVLPPPASIDFEVLARSIETIRVLVAAVEAAIAEEKRKKRQREENALMMILMEIL